MLEAVLEVVRGRDFSSLVVQAYNFQLFLVGVRGWVCDSFEAHETLTMVI